MSKPLLKQIMAFLVVGGIAFTIDYALLYILTDFIHIHYFISSMISFTVSLIFNYIFSMKYVFKIEKETPKSFSIFVILSVIGLLINQGIMYVGVDLLSLYYMLVKIIATGIVMVFNFVSKKLTLEKAK